MSSRSNNRRKTLCNVPPKRRQSIDPLQREVPQQSANRSNRGHGGIPRGGRRQSMIPRVGRENTAPSSPMSIKSSTSRRSRGTIRQNDIRPVDDRSFQQQCINKITLFLKKKRNYSYPISSSTVATPSSKDFENMTTFLIRQLDDSFQRNTTMRFEDEVALCFRTMGYPFTISKTAVSAAGAQHGWPKLLAALAWLVDRIELISVDVPPSALESNVTFQTIEQLEQITDESFFEYLRMSYMAYMTNDAATFEHYEQALQKRIADDDATLESHVERVSDINATILERIQEAEAAVNLLPSQKAKHDDYAKTLEEFGTFIDEANAAKMGQERKMKTNAEELSKTNAALDRMTTKVQELEQAVKDQEFSPSDVDKMDCEIKVLKESLEQTQASQEEQAELLSGSQERTLVFTQQLDRLVTSYNKFVSMLASEIGSDAQGIKLNLKADLLPEDMRVFLGNDLQTPKVTMAASERKELWDEMEAKLQDILDQKNRRDNDLSQVVAQLKIVEDKAQKCKEAIAGLKLEHESKASVRNAEIETLESKTKTLCDPAEVEKRLAVFERRCAELEAQKSELLHRNKEEEQQTLRQIVEACELVEDHQAYMAQCASAVNDHWEGALSKVGNWELKNTE